MPEDAAPSTLKLLIESPIITQYLAKKPLFPLALGL
jgi:hypothetical protein